MRKKGWKTSVQTSQPRGPAGSGKSNKKAYRKTTKGRQPEGDDFREEHAERPTLNIQHASGAFGPGADIFELVVARASRASVHHLFARLEIILAFAATFLFRYMFRSHILCLIFVCKVLFRCVCF